MSHTIIEFKDVVKEYDDTTVLKKWVLKSNKENFIPY